MNKRFYNLDKINYFKSPKIMCTKKGTEKKKVIELSRNLKIVSSFGVISGV